MDHNNKIPTDADALSEAMIGVMQGQADLQQRITAFGSVVGFNQRNGKPVSVEEFSDDTLYGMAVVLYLLETNPSDLKQAARTMVGEFLARSQTKVVQ